MKKISQKTFEKILQKNAWENAVPINVTFELTPLCNLNCKMCYVHLNDPSVKTRMLNGKQWISLIDEAIDQGMISALLTGGEAMTHPDFFEIYLHLIERGISVGVKSNGVLLNQKARDLFAEYPPSSIDISVYGCDGESYKAVTGFDVFETVDTNIRSAIEEGLPIRLMITPSGYMMPWLDQIMDYANTLNVKTLVNIYLMDPYENTGRSLDYFSLSVDQIIALKKKANRLFNKRNISNNELEKAEVGPVSDLRPGPDRLRCAAGRVHYAATWDGMMIPCLTFPRKIISENILELGSKQAWKQLHQKVVDYKVPKACLDCSYNTKCNYCPIRHGSYAYENKCSSVACELEKRVIDELYQQ